MSDFDLVQIGVVHSPVTDRRLMSPYGVPAEVHLFESYVYGLLLIEENTHIWVTGWLEDVDRERLQIVRPNYQPMHRRRGVFGLRSTTRPNSLAISPARLLKVRGNVLELESLDFIDETPVVDIKRYAPATDIIFAARGSRDRYVLDKADAEWLGFLEVEAGHFTGAITGGVIAAARLVQHVAIAWNILPKEPELRVIIGAAIETPILVDALQAMTGATFGSGRLRFVEGTAIGFEYAAQRLTAQPKACVLTEREMLRRRPFEELFVLAEENPLESHP
ncbi:MAG TPA: tRNA (N6-threonylcarbamoyladenosine(37)-N6)-methyltransferase TrmO [Nitrolancea sp.]|nr:tRNA (N6-threonylcarbamoyladenosine(37)-N6)-methyltransferase TrmO [Nitrolancea sp.]